MAIARRSTGTAVHGTGNLTPGLGAGHTTDDINVVHVFSADNSTNTMPAGWARKLGPVRNGTGCQYEQWWKRDSGSDSDPLITRTSSPGMGFAWAECYSGVDSGLVDPYRDAQSQTGAGNPSSNWTITCPALTGVVAGDYLFAVPAFTVIGDTSGSASLTTITGYTEAPTDQTDGSGANFVCVAGDHKAATGSQGSVTSTAAWGGGAPTPQWIGAHAALSSDASVAPQQLRPDADTAAGGWTTTPLWSKVDEAVAGGDVITATAS